MKVKNDDDNSGGRHWILLIMNILPNTGIELTSTAYLPCLDVGKPKRPIYLPLEVC